MTVSPRTTASAVVSAGSVAPRLADPALVLLDATVELPAPRYDGDNRPSSGAALWAAEHLPGARHADLLTDLSDPSAAGPHFRAPSAARVADWLAREGIGTANEIVVYDQGGGIWAARLWWLLRNVGVTAHVLDGGLGRWREQGLPVAAGRADASPRRPDPPPALRDRGLWAARTEVVDVLEGRRSARLVCALGADQFAGTAPTRYARRGHIPTSVNVPARSLVDATGRLVTGDALAVALRPALAGRPDEILVYCGGGISACLTALGLVEHGERAVRVYDGSLEEWSADPALPLQTSADAVSR